MGQPGRINIAVTALCGSEAGRQATCRRPVATSRGVGANGPVPDWNAWLLVSKIVAIPKYPIKTAAGTLRSIKTLLTLTDNRDIAASATGMMTKYLATAEDRSVRLKSLTDPANIKSSAPKSHARPRGRRKPRFLVLSMTVASR